MINNKSREMSIAFAKWLQCLDNGITFYNPFTDSYSASIGFSPYDCFIDRTMTEEELFEEFIKQYNND